MYKTTPEIAPALARLVENFPYFRIVEMTERSVTYFLRQEVRFVRGEHGRLVFEREGGNYSKENYWDLVLLTEALLQAFHNGKPSTKKQMADRAAGIPPPSRLTPPLPLFPELPVRRKQRWKP